MNDLVARLRKNGDLLAASYQSQPFDTVFVTIDREQASSAICETDEAADLIESQAARIIAVEAERDEALALVNYAEDVGKLQAARIPVLEKALAPFAEAAENLEDNHADGSPIWETSAAMGIDAKHLRAARAALAPEPS